MVFIHSFINKKTPELVGRVGAITPEGKLRSATKRAVGSVLLVRIL